jgi:DNA-directed RNA polymerase subunit RPC12/RpoP
MDRRDHPDLILGGADCAACGSTVPGSRITLLAERDDLVFAELACPRCGSNSLAIVVRAAPTPDPVSPHVARRSARPAVSSDDVLDMHEFLSGYEGDLHALVDRSDRPSAHRRTRPPGRSRS